MNVIQNCMITKQTSRVIRECVMSTSDPLYRTYGGYYTGMDIQAKDVYSLYDGIVVFISNTNTGKCVIIRTDDNMCMSYSSRAFNINVVNGQFLARGDFIGSVKQYIHVESLSTIPSRWPVRVESETWYKSNVSGLIYGDYVPPSNQILLSPDLINSI